MSLEDFRISVLIAVNRYGSFTKAAHALGVSQSAVSQNISDLEKAIGAKMFTRNRSCVALTPKGMDFLEHALKISASCKEAEQYFSNPGSILIKDVLLDGKKTNILVNETRFKDLNAPSDTRADRVLDADGMAILPAFYNAHTHAAMTLLRGYADDLPLKEWLENYIWPFEAKMTASDIENGSRIAVREMIDSGTVFFNDMYFEVDRTIDVVREEGMRAEIGITVMDNHSKAVSEQKNRFIKTWSDPTSGRVNLAMAPHAIYTVGRENLVKKAAFARENGMRIHMHAAETIQEVKDCIKEHGMTPVRYLDSLGLLGPDVILAHCVHVNTREEWDLLAEKGVTVCHCPCSNMKLGSGRFPYELAISSGVRITLGTDGASSNNNLDMREEMKFAALMAKMNGDTTLLPAGEVFKWATKNGAEAFGIEAGEIKAGLEADFLLVDLSNPKMIPCTNPISNFVYSADSSCIKHVACRGRILK